MAPPSEGERELERRLRRQEVVAELGRQALGTDDVEEVLREAATAVRDALGTDFGAVFELLPAGNEALLSQGVGWRDGAVGETTVPVDADSQVGHALESTDPVVVDDFEAESHTSRSELLADHGVVSGVSAVVAPSGEPWGALGAYATDRREFAKHDAEFVRDVADTLASAIEDERARGELEEMYGRISEAFFALDEEWRFTYLNERAHEVINPAGETLVGENVWTAFPEAIGRKFREQYEHAMYEQEAVVFEEYYPEPLDAWFEVRAYPSETGLSVYFRDVTERVERERELRETKNRLEIASAAGSVGTWTWDVENDVVTADEYLAENYGIDPEMAAAGRPMAEFYDPIHEDDEEETWEQLERALETGELDVEFRVRGPDGETRWFLARGEVTYDDGDPVRMHGAISDITERTEHQRRLERYRQYTDDILNAVDDVFYVVDDSGDLKRWNETVPEVTGYSNAEIESMSALEFFGEDADRVAAAIAEGFEDGSALVEVSVRTRDGESIPYELAAASLEDSEGNPVLAGIGRDITARKERERRLEELVDRLEESNERLEQFAYAASHDLQEPLRMVSSYLQLLERRYGDDLDADGREFIEFAVDGADRMRNMIEGLLEYSRVETRGDPFEPIDLGAVFTDVLDDLQMRIAESDADIAVGDLPRVEGDSGQLRQVFQNLLSNAMEYSGDDPPRIRVSAERDGDEWTISVRDEGIGIDPGDADSIFQVFQRLHPPDEHAGTGIGLALCERIVERHDGEIWVDSEPGEGATFSFTLPAATDRSD